MAVDFALANLTEEEKQKSQGEKQKSEEYDPSAKLKNPIGTSSIPDIANRIIKIIMGLVGSISLLVFIYAGFLWLTARGDPGKISGH